MKTNWTTTITRGLVACVLAAGFAAGDRAAQAQTSFTDTVAATAWNASRWNNTADSAPYTAAFTPGNAVSFTSGSYSFAGMGSSINVGNINLADNVTVNFPSIGSSIATGGNVRTITVGTNALMDFQTQAFSTAAGTGFIKSGSGVLATAGGGYSGGFTLNNGTVIMRGVDAMGGSATNVLTLNGGVVASNASRAMTSAKYGGGIVIGGNVQFGELATVVSIASSAANLSFANDVSLGSATRTLTVGNNGTQTFSGIISNTSGGLTFAANPGTTGRFDLGGANTYTGNTAVNSGIVRLITGNDRLPTATVLSLGQTASANLGTFDLNGQSQQIAGLNSTIGTNATASNNTITSAGAATLTINGNGSYGDGTNANSGVITGAISLVKTGAGTQTLGDANTYTGTTSITGGTLEIASTGSINGTSGVTVNGGELKYNSSTSLTQPVTFTSGTISGTGTIASALTVASGATLSPGNSPGIQAFGGDQTWATDGNYNWQILDATGSAGTGFDQIQITGTLDVQSGFNLNLWSLSSIGPDVNGSALNFNNTLGQSWIIATTTGGILNGGNLASADISVGAINGTGGFLNGLGGGSFSVAAAGNNVVLTFVPVPEPGSLALLAFGGVAFLAWNRRRLSSK